MKKARRLVLAAVMLLAVAAMALSGCVVKDKKYFDKVTNYSFWDNKGNEAIAQKHIYSMMDSYLSDGTITDGKVISSTGKVKKVMFLGWDGVRADALTNIFYDENSKDTNGYNYQPDAYSGLHYLKGKGGLYLSYAGGETGKDSEQSSSTCAGWTSILTGDWHTNHGVKENSDIKNKNVDTIMMKYAKLGVTTGLAFDWGQLFDLTFQHEVSQIVDNKSLPIKYCDIDRAAVTSKSEIVKNEGLKNEKGIYAPSVDHYNAVANDNISAQALYDISARDYLMERITRGDTFAGAIFHRPDTNGHNTEFGNHNPNYVNSVRNADLYLYQLIEQIEEREANMNEEWLIIVAPDHGGSGRDHGMQIFEHRTTFLATNRPVDSKYYSSNYNGYTDGK